MRHVTLLVGAALLVVGCQGRLREAYHFPATWPGSQPLREDAPTVSVQPLSMALAPRADASGAVRGIPTAAVLSVLFIKHLHVNGVNAILEQAEESTARYALACTIPQLGYGVQDGFPQERRYAAELSCSLRDEQTHEVVWKRTLKQHYEVTVLLDLLTKLPAQPHEHDRVLYRECIVPLWDAMASSVGTVVVSRQGLARLHEHSPALPAQGRH